MIKYILVLAAVVIAIGRVFIAPHLTGIPSIEGSYEAFVQKFAPITRASVTGCAVIAAFTVCA